MSPLKKGNLEQKLSFQMFNELLKSCKKMNTSDEKADVKQQEINELVAVTF